MSNTNMTGTIMVQCNVVVTDEMRANVARECRRPMSDQDIADSVLFAFVNPKIGFLDEEAIEGGWDCVCDFPGTISDFVVTAG